MMDCEESSDGGASLSTPSLGYSGDMESEPSSASLMRTDSDHTSECANGGSTSYLSSLSSGPVTNKPPPPQFVIIPESDNASLESSLNPLSSVSNKKEEVCCKPPIPEYITIPESDGASSEDLPSRREGHRPRLAPGHSPMMQGSASASDLEESDGFSCYPTSSETYSDEAVNSSDLSSNPPAPQYIIDSEDLQKIKGDAIGDTLYSERWTLQTLIKITQYADEMWCEDFETDMCTLWDMTQDKDVVHFLLQQNIVVIIRDALGVTRNNRFTEILVGTLGNLCCVKEGRDSLLHRTELLDYLMTICLINRPETELLIQFFRLVHALAWDLVTGSSPSGDWLENQLRSSYLIPCITFFLRSSTSEELLRVILEFLNTLCGLELSDKDFSQYFSTLQEFVEGMVECWRELFSEWSPEENFPNKQLYKTAYHWISVLCSLTGHERGRIHLCKCGIDLGEICKKIVSRPDDYIDNIFISAVCLLDTILTEYFDRSTFHRFLHILNLLYKDTEVTNKDDSMRSDEDNLDEHLTDGIENLCYSINTKLRRGDRAWALRDLSPAQLSVFRQAVSKREILFNCGRGR